MPRPGDSTQVPRATTPRPLSSSSGSASTANSSICSAWTGNQPCADAVLDAGNKMRTSALIARQKFVCRCSAIAFVTLLQPDCTESPARPLCRQFRVPVFAVRIDANPDASHCTMEEMCPPGKESLASFRTFSACRGVKYRLSNQSFEKCLWNRTESWQHPKELRPHLKSLA